MIPKLLGVAAPVSVAIFTVLPKLFFFAPLVLMVTAAQLFFHCIFPTHTPASEGGAAHCENHWTRWTRFTEFHFLPENTVVPHILRNVSGSTAAIRMKIQSVYEIVREDKMAIPRQRRVDCEVITTL